MMKTKKIFTTGLAVLILSACGSDSDSKQSSETPSVYQGVWLAPAYGRGIEVKNDTLTLFDYTTDFCFESPFSGVLEFDDLESAFELQNNNTEMELKLGNGAGDIYAPGEVYSKELEMPAACAQGLMPQAGDSNYTADFEKDLAYFYQVFKEFSISIELQQLDWESIYMSAEQALAVNPTASTLTSSLIDMMVPLKDSHTSLGDEDADENISFSGKPLYVTLLLQEFLDLNNLSQIENQEQEQAAVVYIEEQIDLLNNIIFGYADSEADITVAANDMLIWFQLDGIGYLQIAGMSGFAGDDNDEEQALSALETALDQAMNDLQYTQGLIIDVRRNSGGMDFISLAIASRFTDTKTPVYKKQARLGSARTALREVSISPRGNFQYINPIVLLTSASTESAAEIFSMSMANLPHVSLIGEATQGAFSDSLEKSLPLGMPFSLSNEYYLTLDGEWLEGKGVPVDIELPAFVQTERLAENDLALEVAFEYLSNQ